jgi:hypothetical protein
MLSKQSPQSKDWGLFVFYAPMRALVGIGDKKLSPFRVFSAHESIVQAIKGALKMGVKWSRP